ncbi:MAG: acyltransferase [Candidatus Aceula meridiana]|nr:acyltransferase [Candidatus Aceula meridiana]
MNYFKHPLALVGKEANVGDKTRIWAFVNIQDGASVGKQCNICDGCFVEKGAVVGDNVTIKNSVAVFDGVTLEDNVFCGANVVFVNDRHPRSHYNDSWDLEKVVVKKGATLGSNSTVLCGVTIGEYAFIGAGSVVTKDVASHALLVGNPAKPVGFVCRCGQKLEKTLVCPCGLKYHQEKESLICDA